MTVIATRTISWPFNPRFAAKALFSSSDLEHPYLFDVRADLVFHLITHLCVKKGLSERGMNTDLAIVRRILAFDSNRPVGTAVDQAASA